MATGVVRGEIQMTSSDSAGPKIVGQMKTASNYLLRGPSYTALKSPLAVMLFF